MPLAWFFVEFMKKNIKDILEKIIWIKNQIIPKIVEIITKCV